MPLNRIDVPTFTLDLLAEANDGGLAGAWEVYQRAGLHLLPLAPKTKRPLTRHGFYDASNQPEVIAEWRLKWPEANIGWSIPQGVVSIDIDDLDESDRLEDRYGRICSPLAIRTSRGVQLLYETAADLKTSTGQLADKIDVRVAGGYIVLPPSIHPSGWRYSWWAVQDAMDGELNPPPLPGWMTDQLHWKRDRTARLDRNERPSQTFAAGSRNTDLTSLAGALRSRGLPYGTMLTTLHEVNRCQCNPPLDPSEVERIARSIARYEPVNRPSGSQRRSLRSSSLPNTVGADHD